MRICLIAGSFPLRSETFIREHALGLARNGHEVHVVSGGPGDDISVAELREIDNSGIRRIQIASASSSRMVNFLRLAIQVLRFPSSGKYLFPRRPWRRRDLFTAAERIRKLKRIKPDVIHVHFGMIAGALQRVGNFSNMVITWHGLDANVFPRLRGEKMYHELFDSIAIQTVGSSFMTNRLKVLGAREESIRVIPMGVDLSRFKANSRRYRGAHGLKILSIGRLDEMKGHHILIQAAKCLAEEGVPITIRIAGDGPLRPQLSEQIRVANLEDSVKLLGSLSSEDVQRELELADLFALTGVVAADGRVETQGLAIIEAQAVGLPVVTSDVGGVAESIIDGETGILCPAGDIGRICEAIRFFVDQPEQRKSFGEKGRRFVEGKFDIEKMLDSFEEIYRELIHSAAKS